MASKNTTLRFSAWGTRDRTRTSTPNLARQMALLLDDPAQAVRLGALARKRAQEVYGERNMIERHARIYHDLGAAANP